MCLPVNEGKFYVDDGKGQKNASVQVTKIYIFVITIPAIIIVIYYTQCESNSLSVCYIDTLLFLGIKYLLRKDWGYDISNDSAVLRCLDS